MRPFRIGFVLLLLTGIIRCAQAPDSPTTSSSGSGSPAVVPYCDNVAFVDARPGCNACYHRECCAELARCASAGETSAGEASTGEASPTDHMLGNLCLDCAVGNISDSRCDPVAKLEQELRGCSQYRCQPECYPPPPCINREHGPDGGVGCMVAPEPDGGVTAEECTMAQSVILRGEVDGKPFDRTSTNSYTSFNQISMPFTLIVGLPGKGDIHLYWNNVCLYSDAPSVPVTGTVKLPDDSTVRGIKTCSQLWRYYNESIKDFAFRFNILFDGGQLTGCAR